MLTSMALFFVGRSGIAAGRGFIARQALELYPIEKIK